MIETYSGALPQSAYRATGDEGVVFSSMSKPSGPLPAVPQPCLANIT